MKPGLAVRPGTSVESGGVRVPGILAGLVSGGGHLGGIVVAFQPVPGAACPPASGRLCSARTVVAPAKTASPW
jgi:hypothetical protein